MRCMYAKFAHFCNKPHEQVMINNSKIKPYHHIKIDQEFKSDCRVWVDFLDNKDLELVVSRPMLDLRIFKTSEEISFYTDASAAKTLGFDCVLDKNWCYGTWEPNFIEFCKPSIEFLELYALVVGLLTWEKKLANCRIIIHCDNMAVVNMVNNLASNCNKCMILLRIMTLNGLLHNRRVSVVHVKSENNTLSDALSCSDFKHFRQAGPHMNLQQDIVDPRVKSAMKIFTLSYHNKLQLVGEIAVPVQLQSVQSLQYSQLMK